MGSVVKENRIGMVYLVFTTFKVQSVAVRLVFCNDQKYILIFKKLTVTTLFIQILYIIIILEFITVNIVIQAYHLALVFNFMLLSTHSHDPC